VSGENDRRIRDLGAIIEGRCGKILERFGQVAVEDVKDRRLISAVEDVKKYWRDFSRPALTCFSCEAVGGDPEVAENAGLAFTLASSGFGIHDDIIDKSSFKHLRMTILGLHGVDTAILVGDLLMMKAWAIMHEMLEKKSSPLTVAAVFKEYGRCCTEVCEAEFMETLCRRNLDTDLQFYLNVLWKAMGETSVCCRVGAMLGGGEAVVVEALSEFGRRVGFVSRLADDLEDCLNVKGDLEHRILCESLPLPFLFAARSSVDRYSKIKAIVDKSCVESSDVKSLLELCFESGAFDYVRDLAVENRKRATYEIELLKPSSSVENLLFILYRSCERIDSLCV
jgi:heptaprenyl diphosphate synthase